MYIEYVNSRTNRKRNHCYCEYQILSEKWNDFYKKKILFSKIYFHLKSIKFENIFLYPTKLEALCPIKARKKESTQVKLRCIG